MSIEIVDYRLIKDTIFQGHPRTKPVTRFTIHGTGGGNAKNIFGWWDSLKPHHTTYKRYQKGIALFHYMIEKNSEGTIYEIIDPDFWVYHASVGSWDMGSIGVELCNKGRDNSGDYWRSQYASLLELLIHCCEKYPIKEVISHNRAKRLVRGSGKNCPGNNFLWDLFYDMMAPYFEFTRTEHPDRLLNLRLK
jgi:N-acetyl-anhydromuramyl-L-alanine amidase AmpD